MQLQSKKNGGTKMKELKNNVDTEAAFTELEEAKKWYLTKDVLRTKEEYLGDDYKTFCKEFAKYKKEIEQSETLEELAEVLNRYTDTFSDGRENKVVEF